MATDNSKKVIARSLYLKGIESEKITELTGICRQTLSRWVNKDGWKELRSAYGMTREELKKKLLSTASNAIDNPEDYHKNKKLADDLVKIMSAIEKLDKSTNVVHYVEAFIGFENWLMEHLSDYPDLPENIVHKLHDAFDAYVTPLLTNK